MAHKKGEPKMITTKHYHIQIDGVSWCQFMMPPNIYECLLARSRFLRHHNPDAYFSACCQSRNLEQHKNFADALERYFPNLVDVVDGPCTQRDEEDQWAQYYDEENGQ